MKVDEVENLLRHYRHDWMNQLQLVYGYATMDKMDLVKEKLQEIIADAREESKLMSLKAPFFSLWIIQFHIQYNQFQMTYSIDSKQDFSAFDQPLVRTLEQMMNVLKEHVNEMNLYEMMIAVPDQEHPEIQIRVNGIVLNQDHSLQSIEQLQFVQDLDITEDHVDVKLLLN